MPRLSVVLAVLASLLVSVPAVAEDEGDSKVRVVESTGSTKYETKLEATVANDLPVPVRNVTFLVELEGGGRKEMHVFEREVVIGPGARSHVKVEFRPDMPPKQVDSFSMDVIGASFDVNAAVFETLAATDSGIDERMLISALGLQPWESGAAERLAKAKADAELMAAIRAPFKAESDEPPATMGTATTILSRLGTADDIPLFVQAIGRWGGEVQFSNGELGSVLRTLAPADGASRAFTAAAALGKDAVIEPVAAAVLNGWTAPDLLAKAVGDSLTPAFAAALAKVEDEDAAVAWLLVTLSSAGNANARAVLPTLPDEILAECLAAPGNVRSDHLRTVLAEAMPTLPKPRQKALKTILDAERPDPTEQGDGSAEPVDFFGTSLPVSGFRTSAAASEPNDHRRHVLAETAIRSIGLQAARPLASMLELVLQVPRTLDLLADDAEALAKAKAALETSLVNASNPAAAAWALKELAPVLPDGAGARAAEALAKAADVAPSDRRPDFLAAARLLDPASPALVAAEQADTSAAATAKIVQLVLMALVVFAAWGIASSGRAAKHAGVCRSCGREGDVLDQTYRYNIGLLVARRSATWSGDVCKPCGLGTFAKYSGILLFLGWWGMISLLVTPFFLLANVFNAIRTFHLEAPRGPPVGPPQDLMNEVPDAQ